MMVQSMEKFGGQLNPMRLDAPEARRKLAGLVFPAHCPCDSATNKEYGLPLRRELEKLGHAK